MSEMILDDVKQGTYDVTQEYYDYITLRVMNVTPAQMQNLIKFVKAFCASPDSKDPSKLNKAVQKTNELETTKVEKKQIKKRNLSKTKDKTVYGDMIIGIKTCLRNKKMSKGEIRNELMPEGVKTKKEYDSFMSAFTHLKGKGIIVPDNPNDKYTLWELVVNGGETPTQEDDK